MSTAHDEAIANANAHLNNAGLPTYGELVEALSDISNDMSARNCREVGIDATMTMDEILLRVARARAA